jgi:hypothetical protein
MTDLLRRQPIDVAEEGFARDEVDELFTYAAWDEDQKLAGKHVVDSLKAAFMEILIHVPPSPTRTRSLNCLVDARMLANAAITHKGKY